MTLPGDIQVVHNEKDRKGGERLEEGTGKTVKCLSGYQPTGDSVIGTLVMVSKALQTVVTETMS